MRVQRGIYARRIFRPMSSRTMTGRNTLTLRGCVADNQRRKNIRKEDKHHMTTETILARVNAAMALKGRTVFIDRADARLPKGAFFLQDIIGAAVVDESGSEIGKLVDVMETPASNVYVVKGEREHLIPAVPEFILSTDADNGIITVHLIEGM